MAGTSVMKSASVLVAALVVVVVLLGSSASAATDPALTVQNDLTQTITVLYEYCPPCEPVGPCGLPCQTPTFSVASGQSGSVRSGIEYPLKYLKIEVGDVVYCLTQDELQRLTANAVITVGPPQQPGVAGCPNSELYVYIVDPSNGIRYYPCLQVCSS